MWYSWIIITLTISQVIVVFFPSIHPAYFIFKCLRCSLLAYKIYEYVAYTKETHNATPVQSVKLDSSLMFLSVTKYFKNYYVAAGIWIDT